MFGNSDAYVLMHHKTGRKLEPYRSGRALVASRPHICLRLRLMSVNRMFAIIRFSGFVIVRKLSESTPSSDIFSLGTSYSWMAYILAPSSSESKQKAWKISRWKFFKAIIYRFPGIIDTEPALTSGNANYLGPWCDFCE